MTIQQGACACWIINAIDTHAEYLILTASAIPQWMKECTPMLRYTYIACLVDFRSTTLQPQFHIHNFTATTLHPQLYILNFTFTTLHPPLYIHHFTSTTSNPPLYIHLSTDTVSAHSTRRHVSHLHECGKSNVELRTYL